MQILLKLFILTLFGICFPSCGKLLQEDKDKSSTSQSEVSANKLETSEVDVEIQSSADVISTTKGGEEEIPSAEEGDDAVISETPSVEPQNPNQLREPPPPPPPDSGDLGACNWKQVATTGPAIRSHHAMAYDSDRNVTVVVGGMPGSDGAIYGIYSDTWEWDGAVWTKTVDKGPFEASGARMVYDNIRKVMLLYGGTGTSDLWEYKNKLWSKKSYTGSSPGNRKLHGMAFDSKRDRLIVVGGIQTKLPSIIWEWDGAVWHERSNASFSARSRQGMAYDPVREKVVLFGGRDETGTGKDLNDSWIYDGIQGKFTQITPKDTPTKGRSRHTMVYDSTRDRMVMYGGFTAFNMPLLELQLSPGAEAFINTGKGEPGIRAYTGLVYDAARKVTVLFGGTAGYNTGAYGDTWEYSCQ